MNRNEKIQNEILNLLRIKTRTLNSLFNLIQNYIPNLTIFQFENNISELKSKDKIEIVNLIYVKIVRK